MENGYIIFSIVGVSLVLALVFYGLARTRESNKDEGISEDEAAKAKKGDLKKGKKAPVVPARKVPMGKQPPLRPSAPVKGQPAPKSAPALPKTETAKAREVAPMPHEQEKSTSGSFQVNTGKVAAFVPSLDLPKNYTGAVPAAELHSLEEDAISSKDFDVGREHLAQDLPDVDVLEEEPQKTAPRTPPKSQPAMDTESIDVSLDELELSDRHPAPPSQEIAADESPTGPDLGQDERQLMDLDDNALGDVMDAIFTGNPHADIENDREVKILTTDRLDAALANNMAEGLPEDESDMTEDVRLSQEHALDFDLEELGGSMDLGTETRSEKVESEERLDFDLGLGSQDSFEKDMGMDLDSLLAGVEIPDISEEDEDDTLDDSVNLALQDLETEDTKEPAQAGASIFGDDWIKDVLGGESEGPKIVKSGAISTLPMGLSLQEQMVAKAKKLAKNRALEIKNYNGVKLEEGIAQKDISGVLATEIARAKAYYMEQIPKELPNPLDYFYESLVDVLAQGDASLVKRTF